MRHNKPHPHRQCKVMAKKQHFAFFGSECRSLATKILQYSTNIDLTPHKVTSVNNNGQTLMVQIPACLSFLISATFCQITFNNVNILQHYISLHLQYCHLQTADTLIFLTEMQLKHQQQQFTQLHQIQKYSYSKQQTRQQPTAELRHSKC